MKLGVIARGDQSGLAAQTLAVANALGAWAVLGVELTDRGRGPSDWSQLAPGPCFQITRDGFPNDDDIRWLVEQVDVVYTAECPYHDGLGPYCRTLSVDCFLHANPELWRPNYAYGNPTIWAPSEWRLDLLPPQTTVVPMPVEDPPPGQEPRDSVGRFLHVCSAAMEDRNGTAQVIDAIPFVAEPCELVVGGYPSAVEHFPAELNPLVKVHKLGPVADRWSMYADVDALILPRRYGGLALPMLEAARFAMPIVGLASDPFGPYDGVESRARYFFDATGGRIASFAADPADLATVVNRLVADPAYAQSESARTLDWAHAQSWSTRGPQWKAMMGLD